ncbi:hypothetical protein GWK16_07830 [Roseomonas sp. JC162]|uniref:Uncharacterized protein n=1 Tax=Neoroseomonas marina TaxID=1232220 RepID=A0A848E9K9_9PROT|nr:hypothetical protein [Neoroseomonas marina]NMJ41144.1 hypothetical protein [Neoroseomonas marina]
MTRRLLALLLLAAQPAAAQQPGTTDWRTAAPLLPLDGPTRMVRQPVTIGGEAWGPWRRVCREQTLRPGRPPQRDCLAVTEARPEGDGVRLTLRHEPTGLLIAAQRGVDGRIGTFEAVRADGTAPPEDARRAALLSAWREQFATLSLEGRRIAPNDQFPLPVEGSPRGGICRPDSTGMIGGRPVLVARCAVELAGRLRGGESDARVAIFARVAIDVATGMVSAQGYATRIETFAANGRSNGVVVTPSRVVLE